MTAQLSADRKNSKLFAHYTLTFCPTRLPIKSSSQFNAMGVIKRKRSSLVDDDIDSDSDGHKSRVRQTSVRPSQLEFGTTLGTDASDRFNSLMLGPQARVL